MKKKTVLELPSDIGQSGMELQRHPAAEIKECVTFMRNVNPALFDWISECLAASRPSSGAKGR